MTELTVTPPGRRFRPTIYWYTTYRCNLVCKHCIVNSSPYVDTSWDMTTDEALAAVDRIAAIEPGTVILTGGDPFVRKDIGVIIQALFDRRLRVGIESNAMLVTDEAARLLRSGLDAGVDLTLGISLDGGDAAAHDFQRGAGAYAAAIRGIELLRSYGVPVQLQCVANRVNIETLPVLFAYTRQIGAISLTFAFLNPIGRALEFTDQLSLGRAELTQALEVICANMEQHPDLRVIVKLPPAMISPHIYPRLMRFRQPGNGVALSTSCNFPLLGILPDGSVTVCSVTRTDTRAYLGNVKEESLVAIWERQGFDAMRRHYVEAAWLTGICGDCILKNGCKGSCRAWAYAEFGEFSDPHPLCAALAREGTFPELYRISARDALLARAVGGEVGNR